MHQARSCLLEIEALSNETSSEKRRDVLHRVTDLFFMTAERQTPDDIATFSSVMERIVYELEIEARAELSLRISENNKAPRPLVRRLATDHITVARPVLERSRVLTDDDLIQIAKTRGRPTCRPYQGVRSWLPRLPMSLLNAAKARFSWR